MLRRLGYLVDPFSTPDIWNPGGRRARVRAAASATVSCSYCGQPRVQRCSAALEIWLIWYAGQIVDMLAATSPADFWQVHGGELLIVAAVLLILRPLAFLAREGLNDLAFRPNAIALFRWTAHQHVARHSVGWFQNDFAGRTATRVRDIGISATGAAYTVLHTLAYVAIYMIGSAWLLMSVDLRLVLPLLVWVVLYAGLMIYTVPRFRDTSEAYQEATSALTGMMVDTYSNMDVIKTFAHSDGLDDDVREQILQTRAAQIELQRIEVTINGGMTALGTLLTVGLVGYTVVLWQAGDAPIGIVAAALALTFRIHGMAEWMLDAVASLFGYAGATREALKTVAQPVDIVDSPEAVELGAVAGTIRFDQVSHHYGKGDGGLDRVTTPCSFRRANRPGWAIRCRQVDARQSAAAVLRHRNRPDRDRRHGHSLGDPGEPPPADRGCLTKHVAAEPLGARQHRLRPSRMSRRRMSNPLPGRPPPTSSSAGSGITRAHRVRCPCW
jgi:ATP-binding cassette, subfamily B, multidrug efflux pump